MKKEKRKHTLFLGPFHPELEEEFISLVKKKKAPDPLAPLFVLVGSNLLRIYLQRLLAIRGFPHANIRFLTLIDFARLIAVQPLVERGLRPFPSWGELVIAAQLTLELNAESYFYPLRERRGFRKNLLATFQDLWESGIAEIFPKETKKLAQLNDLYQTFRGKITKNFFSDIELLYQASKYVTTFLEKWGAQDLIIYGFYDFTESQRRLLEACAENMEIYAFMPFRENNGFDYAWPTRRWFKNIGFQEEFLETPADKENNSLKILQRDLFAEGWSDEIIPQDKKVKVIGAANEVQEVKEIAREVLSLAQEGIPFHEMAILLRNPEIYSNIIKETFPSLKIPIFLAGGLILLQTPEGKSILLLLDLIGSNWLRSQVMEFLTFAPLAWSSLLKEEPPLAHWDLISRQAGIIEGKKEWEEKLTLFISRTQEEELEEGKRSFKKEAAQFLSFLQTFFADLARFPVQGTWSDLVSALLKLIRKYLDEGERKQEILKLIQQFRDLEAIQRETNLQQFREIISEALQEKTLKEGAFQAGNVCVSEIMLVRGLSFRVVFIPGLVERVFPAAGRQDPLLLDQERLKINQWGKLKGGLPLKGYRLLEEKILFSLAISAARERLVLSYPRLDSNSGRERIPSFFLLQVGEALTREMVNYSKLETLPFYERLPLSYFAPGDPAQAIDEGEFDLAQIGKALQTKKSQKLVYLFHLFPNLARAKKLAQLRWGMRLFTEYDGCLRSELARNYLRQKHHLAGKILSPTKLELYSFCPFRYFLEEVLKLESYPAPEEILRLSPLEKGKLVHEILHRFYQRLLPELHRPLFQEKLAEYKKILKEEVDYVFQQAEKEGLTGLPLLWEIDQQDIFQDLQGFLEQELNHKEDMLPRALELRFGYDGSKPAAKMDLPRGETIYFRGRIDRIDFSVNGEKVRIIDYKTGKVAGEEDGFFGGRTLQLPLYLFAAQQIWPNIELSQSWAEYYCLSRKEKYKRLAFHGENWVAKEKTLKEIVQIIEEGIIQGNFFPAPARKEDCQYCDFERVCEHGRDILFSRKKGDSRAASFLKMREIA